MFGEALAVTLVVAVKLSNTLFIKEDRVFQIGTTVMATCHWLSVAATLALVRRRRPTIQVTVDSHFTAPIIESGELVDIPLTAN